MADSSATVIDRLIVTLGLDPKNFKKGEKESAAALLDLKKKAKETGDAVEKSAEKSGESWVMAGRKFLSVAAIFKIVSYTTKNILAAADATYDLSNAARGLDTSTRYLRNFENVAEIMGGTAEGARKTIAGLHKAIFDAAFNGQVSEQLQQLGRLGVRFQDAGGHMRDFKDIYLDTAQKIQEARANTGMTEGEALEFLTNSAGFDPGLARAAVGGRDSAAAALARQEARRQVGAEDVTAATGSMQALTSANQAKDAAFVHAQTSSAGLIQRVAGAKEGLFNAGNTGDVSAAWETLKEAVAPVSAGLVNLAESANTASSSLLGWVHGLAGKGRAAYEGDIQASAARHGIPSGILAGVLNTESRFDPSAVSPAGAVGIAQLRPQYFEGAGVDPVKDIDTAAEYLARLHGSFIKSGSDDADAWDKALMSYNGGERRVRTSPEYGDGSSGRPLTGETTAYPGQVYEYAAAHEGLGGAPTSVQIDEINVHTAATDAQGIANGIGGAMQRKLGAAQAEQGMQ